MDIVARAKGLLLEPETEWRTIAAESTDARSLFTGYAMILSAIPPVAGLIGFSLLGAAIGIGGLIGQLGFGWLLGHAIAQYVLGLFAIWVESLIIGFLAPYFDGRAEGVTALKLAVFSPTAAWLAGIFSLIPVLGVLGILGLYSIYTLYVGLPILTGCPKDKTIVFLGALVVSWIILILLFGMVAARLALFGGMM